jgi:hypothetical protein
VAIADVEISGGSGQFTATVEDPVGNPPPNIIQESDAWRVACEWSVNGLISLFPGTWRIQVLLEGLGQNAPELQQEVTVAMVPGQTTAYTTTVDFAAGSITLPATEDSFSFHITAVLTARTGTFPLPVAAMVDLGVVQIYRS